MVEMTPIKDYNNETNNKHGINIFNEQRQKRNKGTK